MRRKLNYIYSLLISAFLAISFHASGQDIPADTTGVEETPADTVDQAAPRDTVSVEEAPADSVAEEESPAPDTPDQNAGEPPAVNDTLPAPQNLNGAGLYIDYLKLANKFLFGGNKYEGGVNVVLFKRISVVLEAGGGRLQPPKAVKNGSYTSEGYYGRAGLDLLAINTPENKLFLGFRVAQSRFEDRGSYMIESALWEPFERSFERDELEASWYEIVAGTEGFLFANFYAGWMVRYRMLNGRPNFKPIDVYNIPGYGIANDSGIALNLYIRFFIAW